MANQFEIEYVLDEMRSNLGGLQCLRQLLEITDNSTDTLSYNQLAGMIGVFVASLDWHVEKIATLLKAVKDPE
ncbi:TPA: hypothetical protein ACPI87_001424 [Haemophilus influenzae]